VLFKSFCSKKLPTKPAPLLSLTTSLVLLCSRQTPCAQHPPLLRGSTRPAPRAHSQKPIRAGVVAFRGAPETENVGRQGQREAVSSGHCIR
jgi:hypothetical protein